MVARSIVIVLLGLAVALWWFTRPQPIEVVLTTVTSGVVEATVANTRAGTVKACRRSKLAPAIGGQVAQLPVREGDRVKRDATLMVIWNKDREARVRLAQSEITTARAQVRASCLAADVAAREAHRVELLHDHHVVSEDETDRKQTNAAVKAAQCEAANASLSEAVALEALRRAEIDQTVLRAPFSGIVAEVNAELGEFVTPSPPGIATVPAVDLIDDSCLYITAPIDEVDAPRIELGMPVCITLDAFPDQLCGARVRRIAPYVSEREKQARTVDIEVEFDSGDVVMSLLPGYSADVEVVLDSRQAVLRIPTDAVLEGQRVLVFDAETETLIERGFVAGLSNWHHTEVLSGLSAGERIVQSIGREGVEAGARVRVESTSQ